jgi:exopolysaccharide biosynthesis polyprenyl glycosylphosphotransferase
MGEVIVDFDLRLGHLLARPVEQPLTRRSRGVRIWRVSLACGDVMVIAAATVVAALGRTRLKLFQSGGIDLESVAQLTGPLIVLTWMLANLVAGAYARNRLGIGAPEYSAVLAAAGLTASAIGITSYLAHYPLSRGFFVLLFGTGLPGLLLWRWGARRAVNRARAHGRLRARVVVSGSQAHVDRVAAVLDRERWLGYDVIGALLPSSQPIEATAGGVPVIGQTSDAAQCTIDQQADAIVFTEGSFPTATEFRRIAWSLEGRHVQMIVIPSLSDISAGRMTMRPVGGLPLVHVGQPQSLRASRGLKRAFDLVGASLLLLLATPVMLLTVLGIRLEDRGPVFFRQTRIGRDGKPFDCFKFRSMVVDAETLLSTVSHLNTNDGVLFKAQHDPRITKVGRFIRRVSFDELPQLVNVLRGEMSLVGPRPALPSEVERYPEDAQRRLHVRPGLTGLWQVSGRSDLSWDDAVRLDLYYVDNWSIVQDLLIIVRTIQAVLSARGAY